MSDDTGLATRPSAAPRTVGGRYTLEELIGRGGMADVYRGTDQVLLRPVAVKILRDVTDPGLRERFVGEARTLAALNHPGLVSLWDAGLEGATPFLVMELGDRSTLADRIAQGAMTADEAADVAVQLAAALSFAHSLGVIHRDVKPSNVLLASGRVLLVDFGIARLIGAGDDATRTGDIIGSPAYLAPEQVAGEPVTPAADIYALGLVLLEALTGRRCFSGTPIETAMARLASSPPIPTSLPAPWPSLLTRMLSRDPAERPAAAEISSTLVSTPPLDPEATRELALPAAAAPAVEVVAPRRRRISRRLVAAMLLPLLAAIAATVLLLGVGGPDRAAPSTQESPTALDAVPAPLRAPLLRLHRAVAPVAGRVPRLAAELREVTAAIEGRRFAAARSALDDLVSTARESTTSGAITTERRDRIEAAVGVLVAALPRSTSDAAPASVRPSSQHPHPHRTSSAPSSHPKASTEPDPVPDPSSPAPAAPSAPPTVQPTDQTGSSPTAAATPGADAGRGDAAGATATPSP